MGHEGYNPSLAAGNAEYMAPELFPGPDDEDDDAELPYSKMSDVYAFSMVSFEIFTGRTPFQRGPNPVAMPSTRVVPRVQRGDRPSRHHDHNRLISNTFWDVLERCWAPAPEERHTIVQVARIVGI
jgi:serine/threonine protein kinase